MAILSRRQGIGAAPGRATGPVWRLQAAPPLPAPGARDVVAERGRLATALAGADAALAGAAAQARGRGLPDAAEMLEAQRAVLADPVLARDLEAVLVGAALPAEAAAAQVFARWSARLRALEDALLRERAEDLDDLARRVGRLLSDAPEPTPVPSATYASYVLVCDVLGLAEVAALEPGRVLAIAAERGGAHAHAAIVARSLGIPAVVGLGALGPEVHTGMQARVDGDAGTLEWACAPFGADRSPVPAIAPRAGPDHAVTAGALTLADGTALSVLANVADEADALAALRLGADGIGLWRTEWLAAAALPLGEEALSDLFAGVAARFAPRPVAVRMPDFGADKALAGAAADAGPNPALAMRGVRLMPDLGELFERHARAMARAAARSPNLRWMAPMVVRADEVKAMHRLVDDAVAALEGEGVGARRPALGAMVEVPAAALALARLAPGLSFVSIGTNDLAQYTLAADRDNPRMTRYLAGMDPAVLRLVAEAVRAARRCGLDLSVCGELAGEPWAVPLLVGAGVRTLSAAPSRIAPVREAARRTPPNAARALVRRCLRAPDGDAVRAMAVAWLRRR